MNPIPQEFKTLALSAAEDIKRELAAKKQLYFLQSASRTLSQYSLLSLPKEVLELVFSRLQPADLCRLRLSCKRLEPIALEVTYTQVMNLCTVEDNPASKFHMLSKIAKIVGIGFRKYLKSKMPSNLDESEVIKTEITDMFLLQTKIVTADQAYHQTCQSYESIQKTMTQRILCNLRN